MDRCGHGGLAANRARLSKPHTVVHVARSNRAAGTCPDAPPNHGRASGISGRVMSAWEYLIVSLPEFEPARAAQGESPAVILLDREGGNGWEAVGMTPLRDEQLRGAPQTSRHRARRRLIRSRSPSPVPVRGCSSRQRSRGALERCSTSSPMPSSHTLSLWCRARSLRACPLCRSLIRVHTRRRTGRRVATVAGCGRRGVRRRCVSFTGGLVVVVREAWTRGGRRAPRRSCVPR